jgi:enoyl-CoA hydratase/carnithine racemase
MTGRFVEAGEALAIGLVDRVVPAGEVYEAAVAYASSSSTARPWPCARPKLAVDGGLELDLASGLAWESQLFAPLFATDDQSEGMAAFVEKRPANFQGH